MQADLLPAFRTAAKVSKKAPKGRQLTHVRITSDHVRVSATDGMVWYEASAPIFKSYQAEPREFTVDSQALLKAARKCSDLDKLMRGQGIEPLCWTNPLNENMIQDSRAIPRALLERTAFAMCEDETRYSLVGLQVEWDGCEVWARATDGHQAVRMRANSGAGSASVIIPARAVQLVLDVFQEPTRTRVSENAVCFEYGDETLATRPIQATFPPVDQVFPPRLSGSAKAVLREEALGAARAIGAFTEGWYMSFVDLDIQPGRLLFSGLPSGVKEGAAGCWTPATVEGSGSLRVSADYLIEALTHAPGQLVDFGFGWYPDGGSTLVVRADMGDWENVIQPVRKDAVVFKK